MASAVESHPKRKEIIDALLSGESARSVVKRLGLSLSHHCLSRYMKENVAPALRRNTIASKVIRQSGLANERGELDENSRQVMDATKAALAANPIIARVEKKYSRYDRWFAGAEEQGDFRALASIDGAESKALELHARLSGLLDGPQSQSHSIVLIMPQSALPQAPAPRQIEQADVIECQVVDSLDH